LDSTHQHVECILNNSLDLAKHEYFQLKQGEYFQLKQGDSTVPSATVPSAVDNRL
jgi:hypothetical protein